MSEYRTERVFKIMNDEFDTYWIVGRDRDDLDLVEIREFEQGNQVARLTFEPKCALKIAQAMIEYVEKEGKK